MDGALSDDPVATRRILEERSTEDLVSILEKRDLDEWRPEVFETIKLILIGRDVFPSDVPRLWEQMKRPQERGGEETISPPQGPLGTHPLGYTRVAGGLGPLEAERVGKVLGSEGIRFFIDARHGRHSDIKVFVPGADEWVAGMALQRAGLIPPHAPESEPAIGVTGGPCPACGAAVPPESFECPECKLTLG
jgi:hypothetical protein